MSEQKKPLYAKFKREKNVKIFNRFLISRDLSKARDWTGEKKQQAAAPNVPEGEPTETSDIGEHESKKTGLEESAISDKKATSFALLNEEFLTAINHYYQFIPRAMAVMPAIEGIEIQKTIYEPLSTKGTLIEKAEE